MAKKPVPKAKPKAPSAAKVAQLMSQPGTRAALADKYLSPAQLKQRQLNQRLNAPVTEGSSLTNRDLAHQRQAATTVQYGDQQQQLASRLGAAQQTEKDTSGWYDAFLAEMEQHRKNVAGNADAANTAFTGLTGAVGKLGTGVEGTNTQGEAANAQAVRQALLASYGQLQNRTGQSTADYADTLAHVVAPGQKLSAQAQGRRNTNAVRDQQVALGRQVGAFGSKFNADTIAGEQKNVLAKQALGLDITKAATAAAQNSPEGKSAAAAATSEAQIASKYGMTVHQWRMLGPDGRTSRIKAAKAKPADSVYTSGPFAGKKKSEVDAMTPDQRQGKVDAYDKKHGKKSGADGGPTWLPQGQMGAGLAQLGPLKNFATKARNGIAFVPGHGSQGPMTRAQAVQKLTDNVAAPKHPVLLSAALDAVYNQPPHLSGDTVKRLIAAGYKPSQVAKALGVPTAQQYKRLPVGKKVDQTISNVGAIVGRTGR